MSIRLLQRRAHCLTKNLKLFVATTFEIRKVRMTIDTNLHRLFARVIFNRFDFLHWQEMKNNRVRN